MEKEDLKVIYGLTEGPVPLPDRIRENRPLTKTNSSLGLGAITALTN